MPHPMTNAKEGSQYPFPRFPGETWKKGKQKLVRKRKIGCTPGNSSRDPTWSPIWSSPTTIQRVTFSPKKVTSKLAKLGCSSPCFRNFARNIGPNSKETANKPQSHKGRGPVEMIVGMGLLGCPAGDLGSMGNYNPYMSVDIFRFIDWKSRRKQGNRLVLTTKCWEGGHTQYTL